ncbi:MAG: hypothetical protein MZU97_24825 [Bacillus subtilis]|nr:hypothetical protein [Bacillus subtilis]
MLNKPEIVSRGFMYMKDNEEVINQHRSDLRGSHRAAIPRSNTIDWRVYKESRSPTKSKSICFTRPSANRS